MRTILTAAAILLWASALAGIWTGLPADVMRVVLAAATTASVVAAIWAVAVRLHNEDRRLLLLAVADATRPPAAPQMAALRATRPLRVAR